VGAGRAAATDASAEALAFVARNAHANEVHIETAAVDWVEPAELVKRAPFDLVLAADVLYERGSVGLLLSLLPRLAPEAWLADPGRPAAGACIEQAQPAVAGRDAGPRRRPGPPAAARPTAGRGPLMTSIALAPRLPPGSARSRDHMPSCRTAGTSSEPLRARA
jgi:hypothetical protein